MPKIEARSSKQKNIPKPSIGKNKNRGAQFKAKKYPKAIYW
jgi:hypothetical protein